MPQLVRWEFFSSEQLWLVLHAAVSVTLRPVVVPLLSSGWHQRWQPWRLKAATTNFVTSGLWASRPSSWQSCSHRCSMSTRCGKYTVKHTYLSVYTHTHTHTHEQRCIYGAETKWSHLIFVLTYKLPPKQQQVSCFHHPRLQQTVCMVMHVITGFLCTHTHTHTHTHTPYSAEHSTTHTAVILQPADWIWCATDWAWDSHRLWSAALFPAGFCFSCPRAATSLPNWRTSRNGN